MLIEFTRVAHAPFGIGEDNEDEVVHEAMISLNPEYVAAAFAARESGTCIVRMNDGRGFHVQGSYEEVMAQLRPHHSAPQTPPLRVV